MMNQAMLREALEQSVVALDDWLNIHAADHCDPVRVKEARDRVNARGTVHYIATVQEANRAALDSARAEGFKEAHKQGFELALSMLSDDLAATMREGYEPPRAEGEPPQGCKCVCHEYPQHDRLQDALEALRWHQQKLAGEQAAPGLREAANTLQSLIPEDGLMDEYVQALARRAAVKVRAALTAPVPREEPDVLREVLEAIANDPKALEGQRAIARKALEERAAPAPVKDARPTHDEGLTFDPDDVRDAAPVKDARPTHDEGLTFDPDDVRDAALVKDARPAIKLHGDLERLKERIATDADLDCEAGAKDARPTHDEGLTFDPDDVRDAAPVKDARPTSIEVPISAAEQMLRDRWKGDLGAIPLGKVVEFMQSYALAALPESGTGLRGMWTTPESIARRALESLTELAERNGDCQHALEGRAALDHLAAAAPDTPSDRQETPK